MPPTLLSFPTELLREVASFLTGRDVKNLRLVSTEALEAFPLRLSRVFLSPNSTDIDVFRKVAQHQTLRHQVVELVWDHSYMYFPDCWLVDETELGSEMLKIYNYQIDYELEMDKSRVRQKRFAQSRYQASNNGSRSTDEVFRDDSTTFSMRQGNTFSAFKSLELYTNLARIQKENIQSANDLKAFSEALHRFPRLKKITICHSTQGWLFQPFYETPAIRLLPQVFGYRMTRISNMCAQERYRLRTDQDGIETQPWSEMKPAYSKHFRGYTGILRILAAIGRDLEIEELSMINSGLNFGLTAHFFDNPTPEYYDFLTLISRPTFRRLDLALTTDLQDLIQYRAFRVGYLRDALGQAVNLEHFSFDTNMGRCLSRSNEEDWTALLRYIPVHCWPRLRSLRLFHIPVKQDDVVHLLASLPLTVRTIELGELAFVPGHGDYATLLDKIRDELKWNERDVAEQPRLIIAIAINKFAPPGMANWVDLEIQKFIYCQCENPFRGTRGPMDVDFGVGVERDAFTPGYEWSHQDDFDWEKEVKLLRRRTEALRDELENCMLKLAWGPDLALRFKEQREVWGEDEFDLVFQDQAFDIS